MIVPPLWSFALGTLAAWRVWKLLADDDILSRPRDWLENRSPSVETFLACAYCSGFWVSLVGTLGYYLISDVPFTAGAVFGFLVTVFAMSGALVFVETGLDLLRGAAE